MCDGPERGVTLVLGFLRGNAGNGFLALVLGLVLGLVLVCFKIKKGVL